MLQLRTLDQLRSSTSSLWPAYSRKASGLSTSPSLPSGRPPPPPTALPAPCSLPAALLLAALLALAPLAGTEAGSSLHGAGQGG
jgi:hypothetical protein